MHSTPPVQSQAHAATTCRTFAVKTTDDSDETSGQDSPSAVDHEKMMAHTQPSEGREGKEHLAPELPEGLKSPHRIERYSAALGAPTGHGVGGGLQ